MIGHCWFERIDASSIVSEMIRPWEDYGLYQVEYDAPPPKVKTYRATIDGRDGTLDLTEWEGAGIVRYNDRTVKVTFRDLYGNGKEFISKMHGGRFNIFFNDDPEHYYVGRCETVDEQTRRHVSKITMTFTCRPFRVETRFNSVQITAVKAETGHPIGVTDGDITFNRSIIPKIIISNVDESIEPHEMEDGTTTRISIFFNIGRLDGNYHVLEDTTLDTHNLIFKPGTNHYRILNYSPNKDAIMTVYWHEEVI